MTTTRLLLVGVVLAMLVGCTPSTEQAPLIQDKETSIIDPPTVQTLTEEDYLAKYPGIVETRTWTWTGYRKVTVWELQQNMDKFLLKHPDNDLGWYAGAKAKWLAETADEFGLSSAYLRQKYEIKVPVEEPVPEKMPASAPPVAPDKVPQPTA